MASFQHPRFRFELTRALNLLLRDAALAGADVLRDNISGHDRTGVNYAHLPYRSSAPDEYPTEQFGDLVRATTFLPTDDPLVWRVGFFGPDQEKYENLEFLPPALGGRQPIARTAEDPATHEAMRDGMRRASLGTLRSFGSLAGSG